MIDLFFNEALITFIIASAALSVAPGPDNLFVLMQSARYGKQSGLWLTLGLCSGLIAHTSAVALGVAVIFQSSATAFITLKIIGALYLLYLAWQAFKAPAVNLTQADSQAQKPRALYLRGVLMNITNPKVTIFFLAFLPQFASTEFGPIAPQVFLLGGVFAVIALVIFSAIALAAGSLGNWLQTFPVAQNWLNRITGCVLVLLALKLATTDQ